MDGGTVGTAALAPSTQKLYDALRTREPSPRVKQAMRLHATGAVPTKKAAAEAMGLAPATLYVASMPSLGNTPTRRIADEVDEAVRDKSIDMSRVLSLMSRKAVGTIYDIMQNTGNEHIKLRSAMDLADRAPETSKTQKVAVTSVNITGSDAKEIAAALVESGRAREKYNHVVEGDFVRVETDAVKPQPDHAKRIEKTSSAE